MSSSAVATSRPSDALKPLDDAPSAERATPLFATDSEGEDSLGRATSARLLADLASHPGAATPFLVAVHGSSGSGKSSLLRQIVERLRHAERRAGRGPLLVATVDAGNGGDPAADIVAGLFGALKPAYPALAEEALHAGGDPVQAARASAERVTDLRRTLDAERQVLDEVSARQANLVDTVLFNAPGSRVDSYARAHRGSIEARLRAFGLPAGDAISTYKDLVREAAENESGLSRFGMVMRAVWAFKGQGTLIVLAILLLLVGWGSAHLADHPDLWLTWLAGLGEKFAGLTTWAQDHAGWLMPISHAAYALAALAILVDIMRAFRFIQPILRGASLLNGELESRRRDIDGLLAHQTRRVDHLAAEVEGAVRGAEAAERRVESRRAAGLLDPGLHGPDGPVASSGSPQASADAFLAGLAAVMSGDGREDAPWRVVVAIDEPDRLPPGAAAAYLDAAHRLLRRSGFVAVVAADRKHLLDGYSDTDPAHASARYGRCVQLSYDLDAEAAATLNLGEAATANHDAMALDRPLHGHEARLMRDLSAFVGPNPRAVKRFANTYRVARADPKMAGATPAEAAGLALALALDDRGGAAELVTYGTGGALTSLVEPPRSDLDYVVAAARAAIGEPFIAAEARRGLQVARIYSRRG